MQKNMLGRHLYNAYAKHGINSFVFQIICICFDEACNEFEAEYIRKFNTLAPNGYNLREGGRNSKHNEETCRLISQNRKGKGLNYMTEEIRQSRMGKRTGPDNPNYGKPMSETQRAQISERMKEIWKEKKAQGIGAHENTRKALQEGNARRWEEYKKNKPVKEVSKGRKQRIAKLDEDGTVLEEFESITAASKKYGLNGSHIASVCRHERKSAGGFKWKYMDVPEGENVKRNTTTGELYVSRARTGFIVRINKKVYKKQEWFKTLEEAIITRDKCIEEMNELQI
jgi:group I intron endonuclease